MGALDLIRDQLHENGTWRRGQFANFEFSIVISIGGFEALLDDSQVLVLRQSVVVIWVVRLKSLRAEVAAQLIRVKGAILVSVEPVEKY